MKLDTKIVSLVSKSNMIKSSIFELFKKHFLLYRNLYLRIITVIIVVIYIIHAMGYFNFSEDDPFISFRYAYNLAKGNGLVYNTGERVEGFSNLGWVLFLAVIFKIFFILNIPKIWIIIFTKIFGIICGAVSIYLTYLIGSKFYKNQVMGLISAGVCSVSAPIAIWSVGSLETPEMLLLTLLTVLFF